MLMKYFYRFLVILTLSGCAAVGVKVSEEQLVNLKKGETTYADVINMFGKPTNSSINHDGTRTISYVYAEVQTRPETLIPYLGLFIGGSDSRSNLLTLSFDINGILDNFYSSASEFGTGIGLAAKSNLNRVDEQPRKVSSPKETDTSENIENKQVSQRKFNDDLLYEKNTEVKPGNNDQLFSKPKAEQSAILLPINDNPSKRELSAKTLIISNKNTIIPQFESERFDDFLSNTKTEISTMLKHYNGVSIQRISTHCRYELAKSGNSPRNSICNARLKFTPCFRQVER